MIPEAYRSLFNMLAAKTRRNEVNWSRSPRQDVFVVSFATFSLSILTGTDDSDRAAFVQIRLINDQGRDADSFWIGDSEAEWEEAIELYQGARRKAHRIDLTLERVLEELRKPGPVGEPQQQTDSDEDLPF